MLVKITSLETAKGEVKHNFKKVNVKEVNAASELIFGATAATGGRVKILSAA